MAQNRKIKMYLNSEKRWKIIKVIWKKIYDEQIHTYRNNSIVVKCLSRPSEKCFGIGYDCNTLLEKKAENCFDYLPNNLQIIYFKILYLNILFEKYEGCPRSKFTALS